MIDVLHMAREARDASRVLASVSTDTKNRVLEQLASLIERSQDEILRANRRDVAAAEIAGLPKPKLARLELTPASTAQLAASLRQVAALPDPVGQVTRAYDVPSKLHVQKVRSPLGVVLMIYESRPGVTIDAFALCFKAGNACILKGGKEAAATNAALAELALRALRAEGLPAHALSCVSDLPRDLLQELLRQDQYIDLCIPRGGPELIHFVHEHSTIPTVQHFHGVCHIYVHADADLDIAERVCVTAKTSAPATCNAAECVLVHESLRETFLPRLLEAYGRAGVEVRASERVREVTETLSRGAASIASGLGGMSHVKPAHPGDFGREFLDLIVAVDLVPSLDAAITHIQRHGSNHTDAIITRDVGDGGDGGVRADAGTASGASAGAGADTAAAVEFCRRVQSSCVLVNASTRFNDGFQLGLGAEIGISTSRIHAYGVMGLEELTTQRWVVRGNGQTR